eukprot:3630096-Amphidinium_carterae.1
MKLQQRTVLLIFAHCLRYHWLWTRSNIGARQHMHGCLSVELVSDSAPAIYKYFMLPIKYKLCVVPQYFH